MKTKLALILGAALLAGSAFAQTNQVLSKNAVGYVKIDLIASNKLHLIANNFEPLGAPIAISNAFASLPQNTTVLFWDSNSQTYRAPITKGPFGWPPAASNRLPRGVAFFLRTANSATNAATYPLYMMGEVPDAITAPTTTAHSAVGLSFFGNAYPTGDRWTNSALAKALSANSSILIWDPINQTYLAPINKGPFGWAPAANSLVLHPGQGYLIKATNSVTFTDIKPYTWP